jgi:transcriptional regulator with XRE-family HTH domain
MIIGERIRLMREQKKLSQGDIEKRTGLLRCYVSRVENGHTVPAVETLEKFARALEVPLYQLVYDGPEPPKSIVIPSARGGNSEWGVTGKDARYFHRLRGFLSQMDEKSRDFVLAMAHQMASRKKSN